MKWSYSENKKQIVLDEPPKQKLRISGHRFASILGLNPYQSPFSAWCEITKLIKKLFEENKYIIAGRVIEPKLIEFIQKDFPNVISIEEYYGNNFDKYRYNNFINDSNVFGGVMDAVGTKKDLKTITLVIECKTSSKPHAWENNNVPVEYLLQGLEYAYLKGLDRVVFVCAFLQEDDYNHPEMFVPTKENTKVVVKKIKDVMVEVNGQYMSFQEIIEYCENWWKEHIETGISPTFDEKQDKEYLNILRTSNPVNDNSLDELCDYAKKLSDELDELKTSTGIDSKEKELKNIKESIKEKLMGMLKKNETKITYKQYKLNGTISEKFDSKKFKEKHEDLYNKYITTSVTYKMTEINEKGEE